MNNTLFLKFRERLVTLGERDYIFALICYHIAPILAGLKPASIITLRNGEKNDFALWIKYREDFLKAFNVEYLEIKKKRNEFILLFYRRQLLENVLREDETVEFLRKYGYNEEMELLEKLLYLKSRFSKDCPHEMGIFLGFPLKDVENFIEDPKKECLMVGYWKVYDDLERCIEMFNSFESAKDSVMTKVIGDIV